MTKQEFREKLIKAAWKLSETEDIMHMFPTRAIQTYIDYIIDNGIVEEVN